MLNKEWIMDYYRLVNTPIKYKIFTSNKLPQSNQAYSNTITMIIFPKQNHFKLKIVKNNNIIHPIPRIEIFILKVEILDIIKLFQASNKQTKYSRLIIRRQWKRNG